MNKKIIFKLKHKNAGSVRSGISGNYGKTRIISFHCFGKTQDNASVLHMVSGDL